jgi:hypothetical protein
MMFHFLHFFIFFFNYQTVRQFLSFFFWDILRTLNFLLGTTFLPQRCAWLYVVTFRGFFWIYLFVFVFIAVCLLVLEIFGFFVLELDWVGRRTGNADVLFSKVMTQFLTTLQFLTAADLVRISLSA